MTRSLPWGGRGGSSTAAVARKHPSRSITPRTKGSKGVGRDVRPPTSLRNTGKEPSTSPPPEPLEEIFMEEGIQYDDKYRMVEDEFMETAKEFTQHLHAVAYQEMKKTAKAQNAVAISTISRPVTVKMPDHTRRKVESIARSKKQASSLQSLLGKQARGSASDDESEGESGAWLGTALHGLMESRSKATANLGSLNPTTTRAAAGFKKPTQAKYVAQFPSSPPQPRSIGRQIVSKLAAQDGDSTATEDDDDDLDAPIRLAVSKPVATAITMSTISTNRAVGKPPSTPSTRKPHVGTMRRETPVTIEDIELIAHVGSTIEEDKRRQKRREQIQLQIKKKQAASSTRRPSDGGDVMPTFL